MKMHGQLFGATGSTVNRRTTRSNRGGFAMVVAISLLAFLMLAMVGMSQAFVTQARRTKFESADAQLRQMLIAGAGHAVHYRELELHKKEGASENWKIELPLPQKLKDQSAQPVQLTMTSQPAPDGVQLVTINATLGQWLASQQLTFTSGQPGLVSVSAIQRRLVADGLP